VVVRLKVLFIGDIVGSIGREAVEKYLPKVKKKYEPDVVIANGENAAAGRGITQKIYQQLLQMGIDVITMGNHTWDNKEIFEFIDEAEYLIRPANFSKEAPGKGAVQIEKNGHVLTVINLHGRVFLPPHDDPFRMADELIEEARKISPLVFIDFHGEATSEKIAFGWYVDGRVSAVVGTHTHVQTADARIFPGGTAYITDVGMTGPYDEILGMKKEGVLYKLQTNMPARFEVPKSGRDVFSGFFVDIDNETGKANYCERIYINDDYPFQG